MSATTAVVRRGAPVEPAVLEFRQYICRACGLIYDEEKGDPDSGLAPGTRFEDIPDDWECPLCGVTKSDFEPHAVVALNRTGGTRDTVNMTRCDAAGVVIVGAGTAGWTMARAIRERDADMPITLVTGCNGAVYDKPLLSVAMAKAIGLPSMVKETGNDAARRLGVRLIPETFAISITRESNTLRTTRGAIKYKQLILAHGATPRTDERLPRSLCWAINDLRCYTRFREALGKPRQPQHIAIVGAGLVGCEMANDLALAGHVVVLVDIATRPLASLATEQESDALLSAWAALPITFQGGTRIEQVTRQGKKLVIDTDIRIAINVDHVISATGLQTPSRLAESAGLDWNNGIAVAPDSLATNVKNIFALGDCISINGQAYRFIEPIAKQACVIASRITDGEPLTYAHTRPVIRVKTTSKAFTV